MWNICDHVKDDIRYFIYGKELLGRICCDKICETYGDDKIIGYIETAPQNEPADVWKRVYSPQEAKALVDGNVGVIITGRTSSEDMKQICLSIGIDEHNLIFPHKMLPYLINGYSGEIKTICIWPPVNEPNSDLMMKLKWFVPDRIGIKIFTDNADVVRNMPDNSDICVETDIDKIMDLSDAILIWDVDYEDDLADRFPGKVRIIDPEFYESIDMLNYLKLYHSSFSEGEKEAMRVASKKTFMRLLEEEKRHVRANVFCSGPSVEEIYEMPKESFADDFNIICNSMVKDRELLEMIKPRVQVFLDTHFFHSPGDYGDAFYHDLLWAYEKYDFYLVVWEFHYPLLVRRFPQMKDKLIGIRFVSKPSEYWFISPEHFVSNSTKNVLTEIMIPIASIGCGEVGLVGCTGRGVIENYFWNHNDRTQYNELKKRVIEEWPAFFKYRRYDSYYDKHCRIVAEMLDYGEGIGKKYINLTTSFIPALRDRSISYLLNRSNESVGIMVSVIVPVYRVEKYLNTCIESLLSQSFSAFELILVDDGSDDNCGEICDKYAAKDERVVVVHKDNGGLSSARNAGIEIARGEYIAFVDGDDSVDRDYLWTMYRLCKTKGAQIAVCSFLTVRENSKRLGHQKVENIDIMTGKEALDRSCSAEGSLLYTLPWNKLYKKELFDDLRYPEGKIHEDDFTTWKLLWKAERIVVTDQYLYWYLQRPDSIMGQKFKKERLVRLDAYEEKINFLKLRSMERAYKWLVIAFYRILWETYRQVEENLDQADDEMISIVSKAELYERIIMDFSDMNILEKYRIIYPYKNESYRRAIIKEYGDEWLKKKKEFFMFPLNLIPRDSRIAIYGAGEVGKAYYQEITSTNYCNVTVWVDERWQSISKRIHMVGPLDELFDKEYDYLVIAIRNRELANKIKGNLNYWGIEEEKIIWQSPETIILE